jgi:hypothetical protein
MGTSVTGKPRFWVGYLSAGTQSSVVVYDRREDRPGVQEVQLYHLKRDAVVVYDKATVRPKLRDLEGPEYGLREFALASYFTMLAKFDHEKEAAIPEEIRRLRAQWQAEAELYEEEHAGDRFKTEEDWAVEYVQSDDPETRELGERMLRMLRGEEPKHPALEAAGRDQSASNIMHDMDAEDGRRGGADNDQDSRLV